MGFRKRNRSEIHGFSQQCFLSPYFRNFGLFISFRAKSRDRELGSRVGRFSSLFPTWIATSGLILKLIVSQFPQQLNSDMDK